VRKHRVRETDIAFSSSFAALAVYPSQSRSDDGLPPVKKANCFPQRFVSVTFQFKCVLHALTVLYKETRAHVSVRRIGRFCLSCTRLQDRCKPQLTYTGTAVAVIPLTLLVDALGRLRLSPALLFLQRAMPQG